MFCFNNFFLKTIILLFYYFILQAHFVGRYCVEDSESIGDRMPQIFLDTRERGEPFSFKFGAGKKKKKNKNKTNTKQNMNLLNR